jgi:hypothetical protein
MRQAEKQPVFGPPESMREHVVAASRSMKTGDWNACMNFLINEKMNGKVKSLLNEISLYDTLTLSIVFYIIAFNVILTISFNIYFRYGI